MRFTLRNPPGIITQEPKKTKGRRERNKTKERIEIYCCTNVENVRNSKTQTVHVCYKSPREEENM